MSTPPSPQPPEDPPCEPPESPPKTPDVPDSTKNSAGQNADFESANEADVSSDTCSNLYLGKLVSDTEDEDYTGFGNADVNHDVIHGAVTEDEEVADSDDYVTNSVTSSKPTNNAMLRQDPLTKETFVSVDGEGEVSYRTNGRAPQTAFVPLSSHPSPSVTTPKPNKHYGRNSVSFNSKVSFLNLMQRNEFYKINTCTYKYIGI